MTQASRLIIGLKSVWGFIVHFFSREKVEHLAEGYEILGIYEFEEGALPRNCSG